ncbi:MAG: hypothetical protein Aurels2KO_13600 [Aureliella sp.]
MTQQDGIGGHDETAQVVLSALQQIGWLKKASTDVVSWETTDCLLRTILATHKAGFVFQLGGQRYSLSKRGADQIHKLVQAGVTLRTEIRPWQTVVDEWIGPRLYLSHSAIVSATTQFTAVVSSRMGRGKQHVPDWPERIDAALATSLRLSHRLLSAPATATRDIVSAAAATVGRPVVQLDIASETTPQQWLAEALGDGQLLDICATSIFVSPPLPLVEAATSSDASTIASTPLRDRAVIALANRVLGLYARRGGAIEILLRRRGRDERFPIGTTYVAIGQSNSNAGKRNDVSGLLGDGVIGWLIEKRVAQSFGKFWTCRSAATVETACMQIATPMPASWLKLDEKSWPFLSHCTRGADGPRPLESDDSFLRRNWGDGTADSHPLLTLGKILSDATLRCNDVLYRGDRPVVSFSQVQLCKLMNRRKFQPHLGRWDWEPYGIAIRTSVLQALGARPVIYGDDETFDSLPESDRAFFQPARRRGHREDWIEEIEWRVPGDVRLDQIKHDEALIFVASRREALAISRKVRWPVVWLRN